MPYAILYHITSVSLQHTTDKGFLALFQTVSRRKSGTAEQNKRAVLSALVLHSRGQDTSPAPQALPQPEDHDRDLLYCTFG